jgi:hypothetical protein
VTFFLFFEIGSHEVFLQGWLLTEILLISASWAIRITDISLRCPASPRVIYLFVYLFIYFEIILYFGPFNPFHYSPLSLPFHPHFFQQLSIHMVMSSIFTNILQYCWRFLFSFPSFPKFHKVVPLLQTLSTSEFVYDRFVFVDMFIGWIWEKTCGLCFSEPSLHHLTWWPQIASIYLQTICCHSFLWLSKTLLCIYTTCSWSIRQL